MPKKETMKEDIKKFLSDIGRKGGKKSKRKITEEQQEKMQAGRKKKKGEGE
jgi:general stress protein YciG